MPTWKCILLGSLTLWVGGADEPERFVQQSAPRWFVIWSYRCPFPELAARGRERVGVADSDQVGHSGGIELDQEIAGASVVGGEELSADSQAGQPHHRAATDPGPRENGSADVQKRSAALDSLITGGLLGAPGQTSLD